MTKPPLLFVQYRPEWIDQGMLDALRERFDVTVWTVRRAGGRSRSRVEITKRTLILMELWFALRLLAAPRLARGDWRFLCLSGHYGTMLWARVMKALGRPQRVHLANFYLHELGAHPAVRAALRFLLTTDVQVVAQSRADEDYFRQFLPADNVFLLPYTQGSARELNGTVSGDYVFSGGWTNRDYDALFRCARRLSDVPFTVVASAQSRITEPVPSNVTLYEDLDTESFERLLAGSRLAAIPLARDTGSSGQMVLLAAMEHAKPVVVPRIGAVQDYVDEGATGLLYELGDETELERAIATVYADESLAASMGRRARSVYEQKFTTDATFEPLTDWVAG